MATSPRPFWVAIVIPPYAHYVVLTPLDSTADERQLIPDPVIDQLVNRLALHRDRKSLLTRFDHLRLCVLVLVLYLGRRIDEVLGAPRGKGPTCPLRTYPAKGNPPEKALWFQFSPNKGGPRDLVYISPKWSDIIRYCVQCLCRYSDEVRSYAPLAEQGLLILVAWWNGTSGSWRRSLVTGRQVQDDGGDSRAGSPGQQQGDDRRHASALSQSSVRFWLNGPRGDGGVLRRWGITTDGSADGPIYHLNTHQARHTRQTALAKDPQIPLLTRQRDLNHRFRGMQFAYQHTLRDQYQSLLEKAKAGELFGPALSFLRDMLDAQYPGQPRGMRSLLASKQALLRC